MIILFTLGRHLLCATVVSLGFWLVASAIAAPVWAVDAGLLKVLSKADVALYRKVFELQKIGQWKAADAAIKDIDDRLLVGHILAQRYLHPRKYRSHYKELKAWLADYADHPEAHRIYKLALRRKPDNWRNPAAPERLTLPAAEDDVALRSIRGKRLSKSERRVVRQYKAKIRRALRRGHTLVAKRTITSAKVRKLFSDAEYDEAQAQWDRVIPDLREFYRKVTQVSGGEARVEKGLSEVMGIPVGPPRPPSLPLSTDDLAELRALMIGWGWPVPDADYAK